MASRVVNEPARTIPVYDEADVLVVGGGPAGHSASVAAARNGAKKVILLERYGHLGGMATGGMVILIPHLSTGKTVQIRGLLQEWLERLSKIPGGLIGPRPEDSGSDDPELVGKWSRYFGMIMNGVVQYGAYVDPEILKIVLNEMVEEAKITTYLHCWAARAIVDSNEIKGVIFESKEGRKAILAKVVIDATGDGDIFASAGAEYFEDRDLAIRSSKVAVVYRIGGCDYKAYAEYKANNVEEHKMHMQALQKLVGFRMSPHPTPRNDVVWVNNWLDNRYCLNIRDLTDAEFTVRRTVLQAIDYLKKNVPGFKDAYLYDTAPQLGTRGSRRLKGEYVLTTEDLKEGKKHEDTISVLPPILFDFRQIPAEIPYRVMVPRNVENLLVAGRCFSSDVEANNSTNLIPHCVALGQAAGTAAAIALAEGTTVRKVDVKAVQKSLREHGAFLP